MSTLPEIPSDVDRVTVRAFAWGYVEQAFVNRPRALVITAEGLVKGIEHARAEQAKADAAGVTT